MKRTSNMYYKESDESHELLLCAVNDEPMYDWMKTVIIPNLRRKVKNGTFDRERAIDAFYPVACESAKRYARYYATSDYRFSTQVKFSVACDMLENFMEEIMEDMEGGLTA